MSSPAASRSLPRFLQALTLCVGGLSGAGVWTGVHAAEQAPEPVAQPATEVAQPDAEQGPRFDIWEYRVEGNQQLEPTAVERAIYPHLGPGRSIDDVEAARAGLEQAYAAAGYGTVVVNIPEQDVVEGVVTLQVVEGRISRLRVSGSRYFSLGRIKSKVPALAEGEVPYLPEVQEQLAALNRASADRAITPILKAGQTPGTVEVELQVEDQLPFHGSLEINDRYTRDTTLTRLNASLRYDNLWQREHSATLAYQVAPENRDEVEVFSGTYLFRIPDSDKLVVFYGVGSNSDVATVGTLGVVGQGLIFGVRGILPLAASAGYFHSLSLGMDYKDFDESINLQGADSLNTPITYTKFVTGYNGTWSGDTTLTKIGAELNLALRGLGNDEQEFEDKRFKAEPNFAFLRANFEHQHELPRGFLVLGRLQGQVAGGPLISNEQFIAGGIDTVRGYLESQALADDGLSGTLELRSPSFAHLLWKALGDLRLHAFFDGATLRVIDPLGGQPGGTRLASAGVGLRARTPLGFEAELDWAYPMEPSDPIAVGEQRVHFKVGYQF